MKLGTKGRYAVMAMVDLAQHSRFHPVILSDIAGRQGLSIPYLEQLFVPLRRRLYVKSARGKNGGYVVNKPPSDIRISDILQAVGEGLKVTRCYGQDRGGCLPNRGKCLTHALWAGLETQLFHYLSEISLEDVCERRIPSVQIFKEEGESIP